MFPHIWENIILCWSLTPRLLRMTHPCLIRAVFPRHKKKNKSKFRRHFALQQCNRRPSSQWIGSVAAESQVTRSMSVGPDYHRHITLPWSSLTSPHTPNHRPELRFQSCCRDRGCHVPRSHIACSLKDTVSMVRSRVGALRCL